MWLIEKSPDTNEFFIAVNIEKLQYIDKEFDASEEFKFCIEFTYDDGDWINWEFKKEKVRDQYYDSMMKKLPRLNIEVDSVSL